MPFDSASTAAFSPRKDFVKNSHTGADVLDICSSWVSHYPQNLKLGRVAGTGMNERELRANTQLTEFTQRDLNKVPQLPYKDRSFDVVTCVVSIDYLTQPIKILKEARRVLRPV